MLLRVWVSVKAMHSSKSMVSVWEAHLNTKSLSCTLLEGLHCGEHHHVVGSQTPNLQAAGNSVKADSTRPIPLPGSCFWALVQHWQSHLAGVLRLTATITGRLSVQGFGDGWRTCGMLLVFLLLLEEQDVQQDQASQACH